MKPTYESPLASRYASQTMLHLFSPDMRYETWRRLWVALARAEHNLGLPVTQAQVDELAAHVSPIDYDVVAITLDPRFGGVEGDYSSVAQMCSEAGVEYHLIPTDIGQIVFDIRKELNPCSLCAKLRRGALHNAAKDAGCNKIALGHHFDDAVETFFLSLFYEGRLSCFQPVTHMTRTGVDQIRPMLYAGEGRIANLAKALALPIVENPCPEDRGSKRYEIKQFIRTMSQTYPDLRSKVFGAIQRAPLDGWEKAR